MERDIFEIHLSQRRTQKHSFVHTVREATFGWHPFEYTSYTYRHAFGMSFYLDDGLEFYLIWLKSEGFELNSQQQEYYLIDYIMIYRYIWYMISYITTVTLFRGGLGLYLNKLSILTSSTAECIWNWPKLCHLRFETTCLDPPPPFLWWRWNWVDIPLFLGGFSGVHQCDVFLRRRSKVFECFLWMIEVLASFTSYH